MNSFWKPILQFCGIMLAIWAFASSIVIGGLILTVIAIIFFGWNYLFGDGSLFKKEDSIKNIEISSDDTKVILQCPNCNAKLRVPTNKKIEVKCKFCKHQWITKT